MHLKNCQKYQSQRYHVVLPYPPYKYKINLIFDYQEYHSEVVLFTLSRWSTLEFQTL